MKKIVSFRFVLPNLEANPHFSTLDETNEQINDGQAVSIEVNVRMSEEDNIRR
jgi:hypothetical protein